MSVDFEFRNKKKMWSSNGTPSYSSLKKLFESGRIRGTKIVPLPKENRIYQDKNAFSIDCGGGCWLSVYDAGRYPLIKMSHFDHVERAMEVLQKAAAIFDCVVLNDLEHGDSEVWAGKPPSRKPLIKTSSFGFKIKPINLNLMRGLKR
jgi:hypothetical protein